MTIGLKTGIEAAKISISNKEHYAQQNRRNYYTSIDFFLQVGITI
jgi:hypothetical protein